MRRLAALLSDVSAWWPVIPNGSEGGSTARQSDMHDTKKLPPGCWVRCVGLLTRPSHKQSEVNAQIRRESG